MKILKIVASLQDKESNEIDLNQEFQDDLEKEDLLMAIEDEMTIEFTDEEAASIQNVSDIIKCLELRSSGIKSPKKESVQNQPDIRLALQEASEEIRKAYYNTNSVKILNLLHFRDHAEIQEQVEHFLQESFSILKTTAIESKRAGESALINTVAYSAIVSLIARWGDRKLIPALIREFSYVTNREGKKEDGISRHYELMTISGDIFIALSRLGYSGSLDFTADFLDWCKGRYDSNDFLLKIKYFLWVKRNDVAAATEYLKQNDKGIAFAVAALADMKATQSISSIEDKMKTVDHPVFQEICKEAIIRLRMNDANEQRSMISMFGIITPTELALGAETDNEFVIRARKRSLNSEVGNVTETDDSNFND